MNLYNCCTKFESEPHYKGKLITLFDGSKRRKTEYAVCPVCQRHTSAVIAYGILPQATTGRKQRQNVLLRERHAKDIIQPYGEKGKKDFAEVHGFLPKTGEQERDNYYSNKYNVPLKKV